MLVGMGKVIVIGAGTMGAQISLDCSLAGYEVSVWDQSDRALESLSDRHNNGIATGCSRSGIHRGYRPSLDAGR